MEVRYKIWVQTRQHVCKDFAPTLKKSSSNTAENLENENLEGFKLLIF